MSRQLDRWIDRSPSNLLITYIYIYTHVCIYIYVSNVYLSSDTVRLDAGRICHFQPQVLRDSHEVLLRQGRFWKLGGGYPARGKRNLGDVRIPVSTAKQSGVSWLWVSGLKILAFSLRCMSQTLAPKLKVISNLHRVAALQNKALRPLALQDFCIGSHIHCLEELRRQL